MNENSTATRLKMLRKNKNLSQSQLSALVGVSPSAVSNYEQGIRIPNGNTLRMLVDVLESTVEYVLWGIGPSYRPANRSADSTDGFSLSEPYPLSGDDSEEDWDIDWDVLSGCILEVYGGADAAKE